MSSPMSVDMSIQKAQPLTTPVRIITAAARFDGHDAAIHVLRRLLQQRGCEVIHLGHNRSVKELVRAAVQEDVDALAISSYQGGHMGFFHFLLQQLHKAKAGHVQVFCGGGGTITPSEADELEALGVTRVYSAGHHDAIGLQAIADQVIALSQQRSAPAVQSANPASLPKGYGIARQLSLIEAGEPPPISHLRSCPVVGITGTGGSGKSTLLDTLLSRFLNAFPERRFAVLAVDPTRRRSGGALLGDRIRVNSLENPHVFFRSMATRRPDAATSATLDNAINFLRRSGFDLVLVETAGIGQGNAEIKDLVDVSLYVMTPEYGSAGQLEKIEMLDWADLVVLNKADRPGSDDALQQVQNQWRYNHQQQALSNAETPVFPCVASLGAGHGINRLFENLCKKLPNKTLHSWDLSPQKAQQKTQQQSTINALLPQPIPPSRRHYLGEIASHGKLLQQQHTQRINAACRAYQLFASLQLLNDEALPAALAPYSEEQLHQCGDSSLQQLRQNYNQALAELSAQDIRQLQGWSQQQQNIHKEHYQYQIRDQHYRGANFTDSLAHLPIAKLTMPDTEDWGEQLKFLLNENLPGFYPYTAGVFPYRRQDEAPTRMFAGEGSPEQTNRRFHYLSAGQKAIRLSTAFDPVTLYGEDPSGEPDTLSRVGMSGVSVATLDDMKILYSGIDLSAPQTSVSLTINGPAPILLAQFFHTAIDREVERYLHNQGQWPALEKKLQQDDQQRPQYQGALPAGHDGCGLALLSIAGAELVPAEVYQKIRVDVLHNIRGTLQADILKEDQAQNECIFDVEFALKLMGDVQQWCLEEGVNNFYTVSVSGYHMAEAGANPVTQLAFTLANGFTLLEYFIARGLDLNSVASQMSFFFSNALDPEYAVIGRVARRIWARALKKLYQANEQAQRFKYHIQTSGRSLQSRDIDLNDVRTTLEALYASLDNCNSLHTNAYDEAITTPTEASVRRALGIQAILQQEFGLSLNQNTLQGSYFIEQLSHAVELAVYDLFEQLDERGGVLGAMESGFQRNRIQQESMEYEQRKQDGTLPIVGVNCFEAEQTSAEMSSPPLTRISESDQQHRVQVVQQFQALHAKQAPIALEKMKRAIRQGDNAFAALMDAVPYCTLGQLTHALYDVGGHYRRRL